RPIDVKAPVLVSVHAHADGKPVARAEAIDPGRGRGRAARLQHRAGESGRVLRGVQVREIHLRGLARLDADEVAVPERSRSALPPSAWESARPAPSRTISSTLPVACRSIRRGKRWPLSTVMPLRVTVEYPSAVTATS